MSFKIDTHTRARARARSRCVVVIDATPRPALSWDKHSWDEQIRPRTAPPLKLSTSRHGDASAPSGGVGVERRGDLGRLVRPRGYFRARSTFAAAALEGCHR